MTYNLFGVRLVSTLTHLSPRPIHLRVFTNLSFSSWPISPNNSYNIIRHLRAIHRTLADDVAVAQQYSAPRDYRTCTLFSISVCVRFRRLDVIGNFL